MTQDHTPNTPPQFLLIGWWQASKRFPLVGVFETRYLFFILPLFFFCALAIRRRSFPRGNGTPPFWPRFGPSAQGLF